MSRIAGVVVLFNPPENIQSNINSYLSDIERLYIIDNSPSTNETIKNELAEQEKIKYISQNGNIGLAKALNIGAELAISGKYDWLLTMDQDSLAEGTMLSSMNHFIKENLTEDIAIISPFQTDIRHRIPPNIDIEERLTVMTSGNLVNLKILKKIGPFLDKLFIDCIDDEYCLRAKKNGYRVVRINSAVLEHHLGDQKLHGWGFISSHHNYIRRYYITRNRLYIHKKFKQDFPHYCRFLLKENMKDFIKILWAERDKIKKIKSIIKAIIDSKSF